MTKEQLKKWRAHRKFTQEAAAAWFTIPVSSYRNWEQGRRAVPNWVGFWIKKWGKQ